MLRFLRLGPIGREKPALFTDAEVFDLSPLTPDIDGAFLAEDGLARAAEALAAGALPRLDDPGDGSGLAIRSAVNGVARQDSTTDDPIVSAARIVYELSRRMVLEAGDIINIGTPAGVALSERFPYLRAGDVYTGDALPPGPASMSGGVDDRSRPACSEILDDERAYAASCRSDEARATTYDTWLHHDTRHRPRTGIGGRTSADRDHDLERNDDEAWRART